MGQSKTKNRQARTSAHKAPPGESPRSRRGATTKTLLPRNPIEILSQPAGLLAGRVARILRLLTVLRSSDGNTVQSLSDRLGISHRTLYRDLNVLERAGVPIKSTAQGYVLTHNQNLAQVDLGVPEAIGLMVLCKIAQALPNQPLFGAAIDAISKCLAQLPADSRRVYEDLVRNVTYAPGFVNISEDDERHFCELQYAIDEQIICKFAYNPVGDHERVHTEIHPLHLHFYKHSWYLLAYSEQHGEVRMFKLARIDDLDLTSRHFPPIDFSIEEYLDGAWGIIPGTRKYDIVIQFTPKVARNVAEVRWHPSQRSEMRPDGSCFMRFRVNGLDEMKWWLFAYADQAIVHEPIELRDKIREMARRTLEANEENAEAPKGRRRKV
jgi:predicted DNA-binding transcriptional regulator YafY